MSEPVTAAATRVVRAGREAEFEAALHEFVAGTLPGEGQLGVSVIRPADGSRRYGILRRFTDEGARDAFYASEAYAAWERRVAPMTEGPSSLESLTGLEAWFTPPGQAAVPPPRWKMAAATLLGVYPLSLLLGFLARRFLAGWPHPLTALLVSAGMVSALTWLVMPQVSRALRPWLHSARGARA